MRWENIIPGSKSIGKIFHSYTEYFPGRQWNIHNMKNILKWNYFSYVFHFSNVRLFVLLEDITTLEMSDRLSFKFRQGNIFSYLELYSKMRHVSVVSDTSHKNSICSIEWNPKISKRLLRRSLKLATKRNKKAVAFYRSQILRIKCSSRHGLFVCKLFNGQIIDQICGNRVCLSTDLYGRYRKDLCK